MTSQERRWLLEAFFGRDMLDITGQIQRFLEEFIWDMVLGHKTYNSLYELDFHKFKL